MLRRLPELLYINAVNPNGSIATILHFPLTIASYGVWRTDPDAQPELVKGGVKLGDRFVRSGELVDYVAPRGGRLEHVDVRRRGQRHVRSVGRGTDRW